MELWIRSQQKTNLYKIDNINMDDNDYTLYYQLSWGQIELGTYKSKERALEVLDEIQKILKPVIFVRQGNEEHTLLGARQKGITSTLETNFKEISTYVYEMPQE